MRYYVLAAKLAVFTLCFALNGCLTAGDFPSVEEDHAALTEIRARILEAELKGDASVFEKVAAPDVVVIPPNSKPINGREAGVDLMRQFFSQNELHIEYQSSLIQVNGDQAFDRGSYSQTVTPKAGGAAMASKGSYWWFYARNSDGDWQQKRVIWTTE
jgi:uncharacterized protein (TIGR02246 family)